MPTCARGFAAAVLLALLVAVSASLAQEQAADRALDTRLPLVDLPAVGGPSSG